MLFYCLYGYYMSSEMVYKMEHTLIEKKWVFADEESQVDTTGCHDCYYAASDYHLDNSACGTHLMKNPFLSKFYKQIKSRKGDK